MAWLRTVWQGNFFLHLSMDWRKMREKASEKLNNIYLLLLLQAKPNISGSSCHLHDYSALRWQETSQRLETWKKQMLLTDYFQQKYVYSEAWLVQIYHWLQEWLKGLSGIPTRTSIPMLRGLYQAGMLRRMTLGPSAVLKCLRTLVT